VGADTAFRHQTQPADYGGQQHSKEFSEISMLADRAQRTSIATESSFFAAKTRLCLRELLQAYFSQFDVEDQNLNPEPLYSQKEHRGMLRKAVNRLSPGTRRVVELRDLDERSLEETFRAMGISVAGVKSRLFLDEDRAACWTLRRPTRCTKMIGCA